MKRTLLRAGAAAGLGAALLAAPFVAADAKQPHSAKILEFDTMVGLPSALTGTQGPIRGLNGGGLPWTVRAAQGELSSSGHLEVSVESLVLAAGTNAGSNPIAAFRAVVSCLAADGSVVNVATGPFAASTAGDADIEADLVLPQPCLAPIVFVTSPTQAWFAITGH